MRLTTVHKVADSVVEINELLQITKSSSRLTMQIVGEKVVLEILTKQAVKNDEALTFEALLYDGTDADIAIEALSRIIADLKRVIKQKRQDIQNEYLNPRRTWSGSK